MQICLIEVEQNDGYKFFVSIPFKTEDDAREFLKHYQCDLYKHINIRVFQATIEDILFEIIKSLNMQYTKFFNETTVINVK